MVSVFGRIGVQELILIFALALIIFGPRKLPELGRSIGQGIREFRRATSEVKKSVSFVDDDMDNEREGKDNKQKPEKTIPAEENVKS